MFGGRGFPVGGIPLDLHPRRLAARDVGLIQPPALPEVAPALRGGRRIAAIASRAPRAASSYPPSERMAPSLIQGWIFEPPQAETISPAPRAAPSRARARRSSRWRRNHPWCRALAIFHSSGLSKPARGDVLLTIGMVICRMPLLAEAAIFGAAVQRSAHVPHHVGLAGAQPDVADEHIAHRSARDCRPRTEYVRAARGHGPQAARATALSRRPWQLTVTPASVTVTASPGDPLRPTH